MGIFIFSPITSIETINAPFSRVVLNFLGNPECLADMTGWIGLNLWFVG
jgi:hypothetical protein